MKRAKVRLEFPEKLFYEKVLTDWKAKIQDKNQGYVIRKALDNLSLFPIDVSGYDDLRKIKGIGENIATRLDAAWKHACENHFKTTNPHIDQVRLLKSGDVLPFLETAFVSKGRQQVPFLPRKKFGSSQQLISTSELPTTSNHITSSQLLLLPNHKQNANNDIEELNENDNSLYDNCFNTSFSQPAIPTFSRHFNKQTEAFNQISATIQQKNTISLTTTDSDNNVNSTKSKSTSSISSLINNFEANNFDNNTQILINDESVNSTLSYNPIDFNCCKLLLIIDEREKVERNGKINIDQHLNKLGVCFERRPLSVGDYLWVLKFKNKQDELVMDYIVERKTWSDLKSSIRKTRFHEQKKRLKESGIRNIIIVAEGQPTSDRSLEQALVSTSVDNRFLIHRTLSLQGTAKFLQTLTSRLTHRLKTERMCGLSYTALQNASKKTKLLTVQDYWLRQLTVCPSMSVEKALIISKSFPSLRSLTEFYRSKMEEAKSNGEIFDITKSLYNEITDFPKALSTQLSLFFKDALDC